MADFEKASRVKLLFGSEKGIIITEDLWDLTLGQLNNMAKTYNKELKSAEEDDFLKESSVEDVLTKLRFDLVLHVLETKKEEKKERLEASDKKVEKQRLLEIKARKLNEADEKLSLDELNKKLAEL